MLISIIIFLVVLSILVLVHELGHFIVARRSGVWVEEFGFGLPPRVFGKKIGDTIYSINALPFGGFVRLHGENTEDSVSIPERAFLNKKKSVRSVIILAGVVMNFFLAVLAFSLYYSFQGIPRDTGNVKIVEIREGSPADEIGLSEGDIVKEIEGTAIKSNAEFIEIVEGKKGQEVVLKVQKTDSQNLVDLKAVPRENPPEGEGALGVLISTIEIYYPPLWQRPFLGVYEGFKEAFFWAGIVIAGFAKIFKDLFGGIIPKDVAGPVGIFALTTQATRFGLFPLINFVGVLSVNLAILNALPFPALDGGRLLFILIERIFGRRVVPKVESAIHMVGMIILLILIVVITAGDIQKLISLGGVTGYIDSLVK